MSLSFLIYYGFVVHPIFFDKYLIMSPYEWSYAENLDFLYCWKKSTGKNMRKSIVILYPFPLAWLFRACLVFSHSTGIPSLKIRLSKRNYIVTLSLNVFLQSSNGKPNMHLIFRPYLRCTACTNMEQPSLPHIYYVANVHTRNPVKRINTKK